MGFFVLFYFLTWTFTTKIEGKDAGKYLFSCDPQSLPGLPSPLQPSVFSSSSLLNK